jgi:hypothetical protein
MVQLWFTLHNKDRVVENNFVNFYLQACMLEKLIPYTSPSLQCKLNTQYKGQCFHIPLHKHFGGDSKSTYKVYKDINNCLSASILLEETKLKFKFSKTGHFISQGQRTVSK